MDSVLHFLNQGWVGALLGVLGIGFGIYQIFRRMGARLVYQYMGQQLIEGDDGLLPNEVVVQFDGKQVPRLSLSQIIVWNDGRAAVRGDEIAPKDPIRFSFGDNAEILKVEILKRTRAANESIASIEVKSRKDVLYHFSFLDHRDGVLIRVLHTGTRTWPQCSGTLIGLPKGVESFGRVATHFYRRSPLLFFSSILVSWASLFIAAFPDIFNQLILFIFQVGKEPAPKIDFPMIDFPTMDYWMPTGMRITFGVLGSFMIFYVLYLLWDRRRRFPNALAPDELALQGEDGRTSAQNTVSVVK